MQHRTQNDLEQADFTTSFSGMKSPEGMVFGFGTTVGNGIEGWAPGAVFKHTDGGAGSQFYVNEGTKTTAAFKPVVTVQSPMISIADANYSVLAANSGKIHLVDNVSADRTFTLPSAAAGLYYEFWSTMEAADGHAWLIVTGSDSNFYKGGLLFIDSDIAGSSSEVILSAPNGTDDATIQINLPSVGTVVKMYCDGTNWFLSGTVFSATAPSYT